MKKVLFSFLFLTAAGLTSYAQTKESAKKTVDPTVALGKTELKQTKKEMTSEEMKKAGIDPALSKNFIVKPLDAIAAKSAIKKVKE